MKLKKIQSRLEGDFTSKALLDLDITHLTADSRQVRPGSVFVAISGAQGDGHGFLDSAFKNGAAVAVVSDRSKLNGRPGIVVNDTRQALSHLASWISGDPATKLKVVALTGTNGKTTTNWLVYHALNRVGLKSIRIGTIGIAAEGLIDEPGALTTPDPISLHETLAKAVAGGVKSCVIETSSHALDQCRVDDLMPEVGVFTNLTRDHLDYHGTFEKYFEAKLKLFTLIANSNKEIKAAVINIDDEYGKQAINFATEKGLTNFSFGRDVCAEIRIENFTERPGESLLELRYKNQKLIIRTPLIGAHNAENLSAAFGSLLALGISSKDSCDALTGLDAAPGRLEFIKGRDSNIYVDYAHTPDALERVLQALKPITEGKLWVLFGCGGDRDKGKRPEMGKVSRRLADRVVVTSDNPRTEDPMAIINDITACGEKFDYIEADRKEAIRLALDNLKSGDTLLIAGKGHEDYQIIGTTKHHFSDQEMVRKYLAK